VQWVVVSVVLVYMVVQHGVGTVECVVCSSVLCVECKMRQDKGHNVA
jgi:hypothetical protein